ncbi:unnamed protein product [Cyprideis torosa]|uniref:Uncharacterized protein n=1 Tax=Cyprideis torosa TaxID=163714 RepID=A0A7R8ZLY2_9CRUS|nr:unnamed protein product [Cyprideis torosa]CAG0894299.1 unnamed protein product [Cyprideis torosa]
MGFVQGTANRILDHDPLVIQKKDRLLVDLKDSKSIEEPDFTCLPPTTSRCCTANDSGRNIDEFLNPSPGQRLTPDSCDLLHTNGSISSPTGDLRTSDRIIVSSSSWIVSSSSWNKLDRGLSQPLGIGAAIGVSGTEGLVLSSKKNFDTFLPSTSTVVFNCLSTADGSVVDISPSSALAAASTVKSSGSSPSSSVTSGTMNLTFDTVPPFKPPTRVLLGRGPLVGVTSESSVTSDSPSPSSSDSPSPSSFDSPSSGIADVWNIRPRQRPTVAFLPLTWLGSNEGLGSGESVQSEGAKLLSEVFPAVTLSKDIVASESDRRVLEALSTPRAPLLGFTRTGQLSHQEKWPKRPGGILKKPRKRFPLFTGSPWKQPTPGQSKQLKAKKETRNT